MELYIIDGMVRREEVLETVDSSSELDFGEFSSYEERVLEIVASGNNVEQRQINYELVGIVVYSGQVNVGYYYLFIKDRRQFYVLWFDRLMFFYCDVENLLKFYNVIIDFRCVLYIYIIGLSFGIFELYRIFCL